MFLPRGFLAAAVLAVRVDAVVRTDGAVLLVAVVAVPFLVAAAEPVWFDAVVLAFGTRTRFSVVACIGRIQNRTWEILVLKNRKH